MNESTFIQETKAENYNSNKSLRYENANEQLLRVNKQSLAQMQHFIAYNPYKLQNYRVDNKKLPFSLPGEKYEMHKNFDPNKQDNLENKKLEQYLEKINDDKVLLKKALKMSYKKA